MNEAYRRIIMAADRDRRDLFVSTARRIGTTEQNAEKDFWVCWTLDALFHGRPKNAPRLLFKGGSSLEGVRANSAAGTELGY
jgi:predicted nucleotidyltransferase component of viral defense system